MGIQKKEMESNKNSVVELHYPIIYQLKKEVKNTFSIYMIPKDIEIAKQNLKQRKLNPKIEKDRLKEIEEHVKNFKANKELREQFDYIFYNDYTENSVNKLIDILKNKCMKKESGIQFSKDVKMSDVINTLPFTLTKAQLRALEEIDKDMESDRIMNRLLQGDVGSRKNCSRNNCSIQSC